jgi:hypothetical protein
MLTPILAFSTMDMLSQVIIALVVVALYHFWVKGRAIEKLPTTPRPQVAAHPPATLAPAPLKPVVIAPKPTVDVPPEITAAIAAAVAVLFDAPLKVLAVQPSAAPISHINVWALEGRMEIFASHKLR